MDSRERSRRRFLINSALGMTASAGLLHPLGAVLGAAPQRYGILGQTAPAIQSEHWIDRDGKAAQFSMTELEGRWVYLKCFQNWCPGCHKFGFPALKKVADAFEEDDRIAVLAIQTVFEGHHFNTRESVRELQLRYDLPIKMGHDPGDPDTDGLPKTMRDYRTGGTPWVVIINPEGIVVFNDYHIDADQFIRRVSTELA